MSDSTANQKNTDYGYCPGTEVISANEGGSDTVAPESQDRPAGNDLSSLLEDSENLINEHASRLNEVDVKVAELKAALEQFNLWQNKRISRIEKVKKIANPFSVPVSGPRFSTENLERLTELGIMTAEQSQQLAKLYELIDKLNSAPSPTAEIKDRLSRLERIEKEMNGNIGMELQCKNSAFEERRKSVREKILNHHNKRTGKYGQRVKQLENDPLVKEKMEQEAFLEQARRNIQSISTRLKIALDNIGKALEDKQISDRLLKILQLRGNEQRMHVFNLKGDLVAAVKKGAIRKAGDVAPWKSNSGNKYLAIMRTLRDASYQAKFNETADDELKSKLQAVLDTEDCLRRVLGREHDITGTDNAGKTVKKDRSDFWKALDAASKKA